MVHAYHVVFGAYGFWLPNDPRGSWSDFVGAWELLRFGTATKGINRSELTPSQDRLRKAAKKMLKYPAVHLTGLQARVVGRGFTESVRKCGFKIWRCSVVHEHVHLVTARHKYSIESAVNLLKGEATRQLKREGRHPLIQYTKKNGKTPSPWARGQWSTFLDSEEAIELAIQYVHANPLKEGKPEQHWSFEAPFQGLGRAWTYA